MRADTSSKVITTASKPSAFPSILRQKRSAVQTVELSDRKNEAVIKEKCPDCGNDELRYYTVQLRSADEGSTVFYECLECGHKYYCLAPLLFISLTTATGIMITIDGVVIFHCNSSNRDRRQAFASTNRFLLNTTHIPRNLIYVGNDVAVSRCLQDTPDIVPIFSFTGTC